jgi:hypothetical protein
VQKRKIPPKQSVFCPAFHERAFLAREICTTTRIIQNAALSSRFQKIAAFLAPAPAPLTRTTGGAPDSTQLSTLELPRASVGPPPPVRLLRALQESLPPSWTPPRRGICSRRRPVPLCLRSVASSSPAAAPMFHGFHVLQSVKNSRLVFVKIAH